jgi:integrase/recombinase XerD
MATEQRNLFDQRQYKGMKPQNMALVDPAADMTVNATMPAYRAYLDDTYDSDYTPDDYEADVRKFGKFTSPRPLSDIHTADIERWVGNLKKEMQKTTVARKKAALGNYFRWLDTKKVLENNPGLNLTSPKVVAPLPDILFDDECEALLRAASKDPLAYLLVYLLLETGVKTAELQELRTTHFDFSNKYKPELWIKHDKSQQVRDRKLKLPDDMETPYREYVQRYKVDGLLFPITARTLQRAIEQAAKEAGITKHVTPRLLRDMYIIHRRQRGDSWDEIAAKAGLSKEAQVDMIRKYGRLTSEAL